MGVMARGGLAAIANERFNATDGDRPEQLPGARVSASFFFQSSFSNESTLSPGNPVEKGLGRLMARDVIRPEPRVQATAGFSSPQPPG